MEENTKRAKPDVDFNRIGLLLHIIQSIPTTLPQMTHISSAAAEEVKQINDDLKGFAQEETRRLAEEASVAKAAELRAADKSDKQATVEAEKEYGVDLSGDGLVGGGTGGNTDATPNLTKQARLNELEPADEEPDPIPPPRDDAPNSAPERRV